MMWSYLFLYYICNRVGLVGFYGISTIEGYLMPNPVTTLLRRRRRKRERKRERHGDKGYRNREREREGGERERRGYKNNKRKTNEELNGNTSHSNC